MKNKIALITGANSGIGLETTRGIAQLGYTTVMLCRSKEKGEIARQDIVASTGNQNVVLMTCDLASLQDIRRFAAAFKERYKRLDLLVNNAGVVFATFEKTMDGFERQWATNHLATFLLTELLLDVVKASAPARIVVVSSAVHTSGKINFEDLNLEKGFSPMKAYPQSKLANILFSNELARRLAGTGVTVNSLHPGVVRSNFGSNAGSKLMGFIIALMKPFMISPKKGAATSLFVATSPKVEGVTGKYFDKSKEKTPAPLALDQTLAQKLWEVSEKQVGLVSA
jgi:retinol dehydrogenase 14